MVIFNVQIALKMKENDARGRQKVWKFSGAPNGARKVVKTIDFGFGIGGRGLGVNHEMVTKYGGGGGVWGLSRNGHEIEGGGGEGSENAEIVITWFWYDP